MEKSLQILRRLDKLEKYYWDEISSGNFKASSGIESCISLRMKLFGLDGKETFDPNPTSSASSYRETLSLSALSDTSLHEIETLLTNHHTPPNKKTETSNQPPHYHDPLQE